MVADRIEVILGYRFQDHDLLTEALTHASIAGHRLKSNERMEFLGDTILGYVISEYLFHRFPRALEGELTKLKSAAVSRKVCALISQRLKLAELLSLGKGLDVRPGLPSSIAAAVLESIIAAIYLDGGIEPARKFILEQMEPVIDDLARTRHQDNFKSVLQQYAQKHMPSNPGYLVLDEKGPDHSKCFEVCVDINGRRFPSAWANSKKEAEQKAALLALRELGLAQTLDDGQVHLPLSMDSKSEQWHDTHAPDADAGETDEQVGGDGTPGGEAGPDSEVETGPQSCDPDRDLD